MSEGDLDLNSPSTTRRVRAPSLVQTNSPSKTQHSPTHVRSQTLRETGINSSSSKQTTLFANNTLSPLTNVGGDSFFVRRVSSADDEQNSSSKKRAPKKKASLVLGMGFGDTNDDDDEIDSEIISDKQSQKHFSFQSNSNQSAINEKHLSPNMQQNVGGKNNHSNSNTIINNNNTSSSTSRLLDSPNRQRSQTLQSKSESRSKTSSHHHSNSTASTFSPLKGVVTSAFLLAGLDDSHSQVLQTLSFECSREAFREFLKAEFASENLEFWEAVTFLEKLPKLEEKCKHARSIHTRFLLSDSIAEINLPHFMKQPLIDAISPILSNEHVCISVESPKETNTTHKEKETHKESNSAKDSPNSSLSSSPNSPLTHFPTNMKEKEKEKESREKELIKDHSNGSSSNSSPNSSFFHSNTTTTTTNTTTTHKHGSNYDEIHSKLFQLLTSTKEYILQQLDSDSYRRFQISVGGAQPIHFAVKSAKKDEVIEIVKHCLTVGISLDPLTHASLSPIHLAVQSGNVKLLSLLVNAGCSLDIYDNRGWNAFQMSAMNGNVKALKTLLKLRRNMKQSSNLFLSPLNSYYFFGDNSSKTCAPLLHLVCGWKPNDKLSSKQFEKLLDKLFIAVPINEIDSVSGNTALHVAVRESNFVMLNHLLKYGAFTEIPNNKFETPLVLAVEMKSKPMIQALRAAGANPYVSNSKGIPIIKLLAGNHDLLPLLSAKPKSLKRSGSSGVELGFLGALSAKLILQILTFLTPESLCVVSQVCTALYFLSKSDVVWERHWNLLAPPSVSFLNSQKQQTNTQTQTTHSSSPTTQTQQTHGQFTPMITVTTNTSTNVSTTTNTNTNTQTHSPTVRHLPNLSLFQRLTLEPEKSTNMSFSNTNITNTNTNTSVNSPSSRAATPFHLNETNSQQNLSLNTINSYFETQSNYSPNMNNNSNNLNNNQNNQNNEKQQNDQSWHLTTDLPVSEKTQTQQTQQTQQNNLNVSTGSQDREVHPVRKTVSENEFSSNKGTTELNLDQYLSRTISREEENNLKFVDKETLSSPPFKVAVHPHSAPATVVSMLKSTLQPENDQSFSAQPVRRSFDTENQTSSNPTLKKTITPESMGFPVLSRKGSEGSVSSGVSVESMSSNHSDVSQSSSSTGSSFHFVNESKEVQQTHVKQNQIIEPPTTPNLISKPSSSNLSTISTNTNTTTTTTKKRGATSAQDQYPFKLRYMRWIRKESNRLLNYFTSRSESRRSWSSGLLPLDLFTLYYETLPVKIICKPNQTAIVQQLFIDHLPFNREQQRRYLRACGNLNVTFDFTILEIGDDHNPTKEELKLSQARLCFIIVDSCVSENKQTLAWLDQFQMLVPATQNSAGISSVISLPLSERPSVLNFSDGTTEKPRWIDDWAMRVGVSVFHYSECTHPLLEVVLFRFFSQCGIPAYLPSESWMRFKLVNSQKFKQNDDNLKQPRKSIFSTLRSGLTKKRSTSVSQSNPSGEPVIVTNPLHRQIKNSLIVAQTAQSQNPTSSSASTPSSRRSTIDEQK